MTAAQRSRRRASWQGAALAIITFVTFFAALGAADVIQNL